MPSNEGGAWISGPKKAAKDARMSRTKGESKRNGKTIHPSWRVSDGAPGVNIALYCTLSRPVESKYKPSFVPPAASLMRPTCVHTANRPRAPVARTRVSVYVHIRVCRQPTVENHIRFSRSNERANEGEIKTTVKKFAGERDTRAIRSSDAHIGNAIPVVSADPCMRHHGAFIAEITGAVRFKKVVRILEINESIWHYIKMFFKMSTTKKEF